MVFIWLGVGNVLSVIYPLRHEPMTARLNDGTWLPFLFSFALSFGVGLTVNLTIYWRLWARQAANAHIAGGEWAAFRNRAWPAPFLSWTLLTVFAVACSQQPTIRRKLSARNDQPIGSHADRQVTQSHSGTASSDRFAQSTNSPTAVRQSCTHVEPQDPKPEGHQGRNPGRC